MIHRLIVYNQDDHKGVTLYDNEKVNLDSELLIRLIQSMVMLSEELGPSKGAIKETELGRYQIGIVTRDNLSYVIIQDQYDNEPYTSKILNHVIDRFHPKLLDIELDDNYALNYEYKDRVSVLIDTMKFPREIIPSIQPLIDSFQIKTHNICDTLFICDLDDGLVHIFDKPENDGIIAILLEILSEIPFSRQWLGESKLFSNNNEDEIGTHEVWFIQRIGMTDFCIMGRAYYTPESERMNLVDKIEELTESIHQVVLSDFLI